MGKYFHMPACPAAAAVEGPFWPSSPPPTAVYCPSPPTPYSRALGRTGCRQCSKGQLARGCCPLSKRSAHLHSHRTQLAWLAQLLNGLLYSQYIFLATGLQLSTGTWMSVFSTMWKIFQLQFSESRCPVFLLLFLFLPPHSASLHFQVHSLQFYPTYGSVTSKEKQVLRVLNCYYLALFYTSYSYISTCYQRMEEIPKETFFFNLNLFLYQSRFSLLTSAVWG